MIAQLIRHREHAWWPDVALDGHASSLAAPLGWSCCSPWPAPMTADRTIRPRLWLRVLLYAAAAVAVWRTLRQADFAGAARLVESVGPLVFSALVPYLL